MEIIDVYFANEDSNDWGTLIDVKPYSIVRMKMEFSSDNYITRV